MALPIDRPFSEVALVESTSSIGTSPVTATMVAPVAGYLSRVLAAPGGTTTGTIVVAVSVNGGSDISAGALTIAAGTGARNNPPLALPLVGANAVYVSEGDCITFTPSGGGGANIEGAFAAVIRAI